jgi:NADPH2:quinone reductase
MSTLNTSPTPDRPGRWIVSKHGPPSVLKWETWQSLPNPDSELAGKGVLVRILVAGIAGVDNIQRVGGYPDPRCQEPGFTTGYDFVGEIVSLGPSMPKDVELRVGYRVTSLCQFGAHATHILLPYDDLIRIEPTDDPVEICALPLNYMTAWGLLKRSGVHLPAGTSILIGSASGGISTAIAQLVKAFKLNIRMIGSCSPSKFDYTRSLGVEPVDRNAPDLVEQVLTLTNDTGVDVAYDCVCSRDSIQTANAATKADTGRVVVFGIMDKIAADGSGMLEGAGQVLAELLEPPRISFFGLDTSFHKKPEVADFHGIVDKVRSGELEPVVCKVLKLSQAVEAHEMIVDGREVKGKMVFVVDAELAAKYGI